MRVSSTVVKWSAGLALFVMVGGAVGVAAAMIFGSTNSPQAPRAATPRTTLAAPTPQMPTPVEFTVDVVVTGTRCPPGRPLCTYQYTIEPKYIGLHPLPETTFTVFYQVVGGNAPQHGQFTVHRDQAQILKDVVLEGPPGAQLTADVLDVRDTSMPPPPPAAPPPAQPAGP